MINLVEKINKEFNNKYDYLKFLNIIYDRYASLCTVTFLYPYDVDDISEADQKSIENFIQKLFSIRGKIKVKFKKSYLDEKLIVADIVEFFKENKKGLLPYINLENISSSSVGRNVDIKINLNQDVASLLDENELKGELYSWLERLYIANISIAIVRNEETLPEEIECDDILPISSKTKRYKVSIEKKIIGNDIIPMPEYIGDIKSQKASVILSGILKNKNKKTFIMKKGKRAGEEKSLYTFSLVDESGEIECVYFCSKTHEKDLENLEELSMLLCVGDIRTGLNGKLTYYIRKLFKAAPFSESIQDNDEKQQLNLKHKKVVCIDMLPRSTQSNLFDKKPEYNDFIKNNKIVVFDLETTGLDAETCEITEIGAVKIEYGEVTERFASFAHTKEPIPKEVQELTHITNEMLVGAPNIEDVIMDFYDWCDGCVISGYNIINFDMKFVKKVAEEIGIEFTNEIVDTINVARHSKLRTTNYKLGTVVKALGLVLEDAHRAFNDAYATAQVLLELNRTDKIF